MTRTLAFLATACSVVALTALPSTSATTPAGAADSTERPTTQAGGWTRFHAQGFTRGAGELCPFALSSTVVFDREFVRTTSELPTGDPRREEYVGPLVVKVTNQDTGRSVQRDLSARGVVTYAADGSFDFALSGPAAVGFYDGDELPQGFYVLRGRHTVRFQADGTRRLVADHGSEENLCTTLS